MEVWLYFGHLLYRSWIYYYGQVVWPYLDGLTGRASLDQVADALYYGVAVWDDVFRTAGAAPRV